MNLAIQGEVPMQGGLPTFPYSLRGSCNEIRHGVDDGEIDAHKYSTGPATVKSMHKNTAQGRRR